jgi:hypothetical protein
VDGRDWVTCVQHIESLTLVHAAGSTAWAVG